MTMTDASQEKLSAKHQLESMIETCDDLEDKIKAKIEQGRIRDCEREKIRVKQWRSLGYTVRTKRKVVKDLILLEFEEEIEELKEADQPWMAHS